MDVKAPEADLPEVEVGKPDVDLKKVGAGVAAGAAAVGATVAAKGADIKAKLPDVDVKKPEVELPKVDVDAKAAAAKADLDAKVETLKTGAAAAKEETDKAAAAVAGKGKGCLAAPFWKWLLPLLAALIILGILMGAFKGCGKGKVDGTLETVTTPAVTVKTPDAEIKGAEEAELNEYIVTPGIDTETVPVTVDGATLNIGTIDVVRFVKGLNVGNVNPLAFVRSEVYTGSDLAKLSYLFPNIPEITDGTMDTLKFTTKLGQERTYKFNTKDGKLTSVDLVDLNDKVLETVSYKYAKDGTLATIKTEDGTINYADETTATSTTRDEENNITLAYVGDDWAACQYNADGTVDVITYDMGGTTGARAFAYGDDGVLKTYESFQNLMN